MALKLSPLILTMIEWCRILFEHRHGEHAVAGEGGIPTAESEIRSEDHRAAFVALRHNLEEQVGLLTAHRQIAYLVDDQLCAASVDNGRGEGSLSQKFKIAEGVSVAR